MSWDKEYSRHNRLWGEGPSELGKAAAAYLKKEGANQSLEILDIGCGYGRDVFYLSGKINCRITGIDISEKAVEIARSEASEKQCRNVEFQCRDFRDMHGQYDVVLASNLYQLLNHKEREQFRGAAERALKTGGLFFLSTLSVSDPEHYRKGTPVADEPNSFLDEKFLHLCTRQELVSDFSYLTIKELYEHEYDEPRATGKPHHHISWILIGERL
jgi:cyclopropane fatty-acyl-phospholipid synthase-like methyltransferase